ncbi:uncharacterized protein MONOS_5741 [Monocercomonoides exilis]|uniref:uncharacterized protein n=1 Tax=Monocercomonoides exilis TaxID=2049356 RepID=UPI003559C7AD|nr:hypothetical protein MONOS_5741 [Monocercomonoides exilis]|eukprot:MONOS_5741.1-p1 / transcript=MONOS_5741.1 / gene=MONOS_5741 / organism=Monocercomonoides_exilis_PA203 / gene_product=unspecified product / transcript_product=unspecified product / location=Mono_scaffold00171:90039-91013(+) / protein_length=282 / sequence_SO=supercontig / SO=protein_coding / is_pseudo=false
MENCFSSLPENILDAIIEKLDYRDVYSLRKVSKIISLKVGKCMSHPPPIVISSIEDRSKFSAFIRRHPNIKSINLSHSLYLTDNMIEELVEVCPHLQKVNVWNCLGLHNMALRHISKLSELNHLVIGDNTKFTADGVALILKQCPKLKHLNISLCTNVDSSLAKTLAENCEELEELIAEFDPLFACNDTFAALEEAKCAKLRKLIIGNGNVMDESIQSMEKSPFSHSLEIVDLRRNDGVTQQGYDILFEQMNVQEIDGMTRDALPSSQIGMFFMNKRASAGE